MPCRRRWSGEGRLCRRSERRVGLVTQLRREKRQQGCRTPKQLGKRIEDDDGLVGARDDGFGDGDKFVLLREDAEARNARSSCVELRGGARSRFGAAGLELRHEDIEFGAVADAVFDDGQNGDAGEIGKQMFERDDAILKFAVARGFGKVFQL